MKHKDELNGWMSPVAQVVPAESQPEQPQGVRAHLVPSPENQTLPDTTGTHPLIVSSYIVVFESPK